MAQYLKIKLAPGQQKRSDISDWILPSGEYIWIGDDNEEFDTTAPHGHIGANEQLPPTNYQISELTQKELESLADQAYSVRKQVRIDSLQSEFLNMVKGLLAIYQAGVANNRWNPSDFPPGLVSTFNKWKSLLDEDNSDFAAKVPPGKQ